MGRLQEYLMRTFGFPVESAEYQYVLGAAPIVIAQNNPDRVEIIILNLSANAAYVAFNSGVGIANGVLLAANGGQINWLARDDGELPGRQLWAIAAAGAPAIYVLEVEAAT